MNFNDIFEVGQEAMTHLVPAASALFVCGIFIPFTNGNGGLSGFVFGICFGITRYMLYYGFQSYCDDRVDENDAQVSAADFFPLTTLSSTLIRSIGSCV